MMAGALLLWLQVAAAPQAPGPIQHVLVVSVDGLRADAIDLGAPSTTPALARLTKGPGTLNARADPDITVTLPNHVGMITGRTTAGALGHNWVTNDDPPAARHGGTLHQRKGSYVASMFDVAHDRGVRTGVFVTKTKFWLLVQSYDDDHGAPDLVPPDNGKCKIDTFTYAPASRDAAQQAVAWLQAQSGPTLMLVHFADPDVGGHSEGWLLEPGSAYRTSVQQADAAVALLLQAVDSSPALRGHTAIILTADHGGGVPLKTHTDPEAAVNFRIPFLVWLGQDQPQQDLAALNASTRAQPRPDERLPADAPQQPIRNADAANLALQLLGLPAVPGSQINPEQSLRLGVQP